jgi:hypothetical protein
MSSLSIEIREAYRGLAVLVGFDGFIHYFEFFIHWRAYIEAERFLFCSFFGDSYETKC